MVSNYNNKNILILNHQFYDAFIYTIASVNYSYIITCLKNILVLLKNHFGNFNLKRRRMVVYLILFYIILHNPNHALYIKLPGLDIKRMTCHALSLNDRAFSRTFYQIDQFFGFFCSYL